MRRGEIWEGWCFCCTRNGAVRDLFSSFKFCRVGRYSRRLRNVEGTLTSRTLALVLGFGGAGRVLEILWFDEDGWLKLQGEFLRHLKYADGRDDGGKFSLALLQKHPAEGGSRMQSVYQRQTTTYICKKHRTVLLLFPNFHSGVTVVRLQPAPFVGTPGRSTPILTSPERPHT